MKKEIKQIIDWTLHELDMHSDDAVELIYRTGMAETKYKHLIQMGGGPAVGFFQCEPATMHDIIENYASYRPNIMTKLYALGYDEKDAEMRMMGSIPLQVAFCRLKYRRDKHSIPASDDIEAQGKYWKRVYNTELGKGTLKHFLDANA
tara:strand:- start:504 stop:947 length:444 start_codon:yes stop_codon:yes gene_type:complete